ADRDARAGHRRPGERGQYHRGDRAQTGMITAGLVITVVVALAFDYANGFHDAANSIATVVSTRVLSPRLAVLWAAFFNFVAAFVFGTAVAKAIASGIIDPKQAT